MTVAPAQLGLGLPEGSCRGAELGRGQSKALPALVAGSWSQASLWELSSVSKGWSCQKSLKRASQESSTKGLWEVVSGREGMGP